MKKIVVALLASAALFMAAGCANAAPAHVHESITIHAGWRPHYHRRDWRWHRANWRWHRRVWRHHRLYR